MRPDERGQGFRHGRLISGKVQGYLLQEVAGGYPQLGFLDPSCSIACAVNPEMRRVSP